MKASFKRIDKVYTDNQRLNDLIQQAKHLEQLNQSLKQVLPPQFSDHCHLANIDKNTLVIHTNNANIASLLRFQTPVLLNALSQHIPQIINAIDIRVRPQYANSKNAPPSKRITLSKKTVTTLEQTASYIENGPLKTALEKLAKR